MPRILLVDDHEVVRVGLKTLLGHQQDLKVIGEAASAEEAVNLARQLAPDVVVMDVRLPGGSGIEACREIARQCSSTRVIMLTSYAEDELIFEAIAAGAAGYLLKQVGSDNLITTIRAVAHGESLLDPALTARVFARIRESVERSHRDAFAGLTEHEIRILALLTRGRSNKEMGQALNLGEKTVRNYVSNILSKLKLASRAEAAAYAVKYRVEDVLSG